jgi:hypothetical protein
VEGVSLNKNEQEDDKIFEDMMERQPLQILSLTIGNHVSTQDLQCCDGSCGELPEEVGTIFW